jgi:hypothetical protein
MGEIILDGLFAYGTLKKDELAFAQIEHLVESVEVVQLSDYEIGIRDSLPVIFESKGSNVEGELLKLIKKSRCIFFEDSL